MGLFRRRRDVTPELEEFLGSETEARAPTPFRPGTDWQTQLAKLGSAPVAANGLSISAFGLIRGGDTYVPPESRVPERTSPALLSTYRERRLLLEAHRAKAPVIEAALQGVLSVLSGQPAVCRRMLLAKPVRLILAPEGADFRALGFPSHANPRALGLFYNDDRSTEALLGLRQERILDEPHLMVHEMTHAVHFLGLSSRERKDVDEFLLPVFLSRRVIEEVFAVYAECAFGARYRPEELSGESVYARARRDWHEDQVFARFVRELLKPATGTQGRTGGVSRPPFA
jgi:hypothetical protein